LWWKKIGISKVPIPLIGNGKDLQNTEYCLKIHWILLLLLKW
jgi:hypothetical protein